MRKLIYAINLTLDGCFDHDKVSPGAGLLEYWTRIMGEAGLLLYGRITYQLMVPYWPDVAKNRTASKADLDFADVFNRLKKIVFSRSLTQVDDATARIEQGDLQTTIQRLKQEEGKDIYAGGIALPSQLIALGLVDEFLFIVHPVIAGNGRRLMEGMDWQTGLTLNLVESRPLSSGAVVLRYR